MNSLLTDMGKIINEAYLPTSSFKLMERIRRECIFLRNDYFRSFFGSDTATIDPEKECVKFSLEENDLLEDYVKIYAYSFGPFNPEKYFNKDNFRILWLLKEPYMQSGDLDKYKRGEYRYLGGHNQANEYADYFREHGEFDNPTFDNILKLTREILLSSQKIDPDALDEEVMNHICILEVNLFPGLAFNGTQSNNDLIGKWCQVNHQLIKKLVTFYNPKFVIGPCSSLNFIVTTYEESKGERYEIYYNENNIYREFFNWARRNKLSHWPNARHFIPCLSNDMSILNDVKDYLPNEIIEIQNAQVIIEEDEKENPDGVKETKDGENGKDQGKDWQWISAAKTFVDENKNDSIWWVAAYHPSYLLMKVDSVIKRLSDFMRELFIK